MIIPNYHIIDNNTTDERLELTVEIAFAKDSVYFDGHFPQITILPAVAQLFVAQSIAQIELNISATFSGLNQIKFKALIYPDRKIVLKLNYHQPSGVLTFSYNDDTTLLSSGKIKYHLD